MSDFRILRPAPVTAENMASNVPESGDEYLASMTYAKGATVISTLAGVKYRFESLVDNNTGNALDNNTKWLDLGATNRWAMFDEVNNTQTAFGSEIDVSLAVVGRADGVGLLNLTAEEAQITVTVKGVVVYDVTYNLVATDHITDWYAFYTEDVVYKESLVLTDLPLLLNPTIRVRLRSDAGPVAIGKLVVGHTRILGKAVYGGASVGIQDFSRKVTDPDFGKASLQKRNYSKRADFKLIVPEANADNVARLLAEYRATNALWIGSTNLTSTQIYGFVKDWGVDFVLHGQAHCSLQIEGII